MARCKICKAEFQKRSMTHKCCSPECAAEYAKQERIKNELREYRKRKQALKTRSDWLKHAERVCNEYIRLRDRDLPCISCGATGGSNHAGHFRSVGAAKQLRYCESNIHGQCHSCNTYKGGNQLEYEDGLVKRIGADHVRILRDNNLEARWTIDQLQEIIEYYREKIAEIKK